MVFGLEFVVSRETLGHDSSDAAGVRGKQVVGVCGSGSGGGVVGAASSQRAHTERRRLPRCRSEPEPLKSKRSVGGDARTDQCRRASAHARQAASIHTFPCPLLRECVES